MIWVVAFFLQFLPRFIAGIARAPFCIASDEWGDLRDEVASFRIKKERMNE
jgi:hypothetical protein